MELEFSMIALIVVPAIILLAIILFIANQYKRCPSNKIIVV